MTHPPNIRDIPPEELPQLVSRWQEPPYRGRQMARWLYRNMALNWDEMTDLPLTLRTKIASGHLLPGLTLIEKQISQDETRKFLFRLPDDNNIESVIIPMQKHATFCISSQVGCRMACRFCATARGGLQRSLTRGEILEQVTHLQRNLQAEPFTEHGGRQFNIVFMGMGEPLDNWSEVSEAIGVMLAESGCGMSARRVTVSTSGHVSHLAKILKFPHPIGLTLSLGGATEPARKRLMPVAGRSPLAESLDLAAEYGRRIRRKVTLAYVLIAGKSDPLSEAQRLAALARGGPFKINLIPLNSLPDDPLTRPDEQQILNFQKILVDAGIPTFIRESGGQDIAAACGQLRRRHQEEGRPTLDTPKN